MPQTKTTTRWGITGSRRKNVVSRLRGSAYSAAKTTGYVLIGRSSHP